MATSDDKESSESTTREGIEYVKHASDMDSSVQDGVLDTGVDNPAFSADVAEEQDEVKKEKHKSEDDREKIDEEEKKDEKVENEHQDYDEEPAAFTKVEDSELKRTDDNANEKKGPVDEVKEKERREKEEREALPATMEVQTVQMDTRTKVVSTHKEEAHFDATGTSDYDQVVDADRLWVTDSRDAVKLRMEKDGIGAERPRTIPSVFIETVRKAGNHIALAHKVDGKWMQITYLEYLQNVKAAAKSFINLGLEPAHGVGILGFNSPEWFTSLLGSIFAGGLGVGIYTTNSPEAVQHVLQDACCNIAIVENDAQLQKVLKVRDQLPHLKAIVLYTGSLKQEYENVYTWSEFMAMGKDVTDEDLDARIRYCAPNKCSTVIYTSGSTGNPKGVMLSHDAITWTCKVIQMHCRFRWMKEIAISYLPLSHIAAQLTDVYAMISCAGTVFFAQPDALKGSLGVTIKEVRPTQFLGVPRVWEKMNEKLRAVGKQSTGLKKKIATWAKGVGLRSNLAAMNGQRKPFSYHIAKILVFKKVKKVMGFDRCVSFYSGAAPISMDTLHYFYSLDMPIIEIYGMSESSGPQHVATIWDFLIGTVGPVMPGAKTVLKDQDKDGNGEICFWGRNVFMGYLNSEEKTSETIDEEGFLCSGDIGKWDKTGHYLSITGRIKEIIITAGGENVAPVLLEDNVKSELPIVSNCMLIGDKRKFLSLLITLKTEVDLDTMVPGSKLTQEAIDWAVEQGSKSTSVSDILDTTDARIMRGIQQGIERANKRAPSRAQNIQKWTILPLDFSIPGGELTPTMKLKRNIVLKCYAKTIEAFYQGT